MKTKEIVGKPTIMVTDTLEASSRLYDNLLRYGRTLAFPTKLLAQKPIVLENKDRFIFVSFMEVGVKEGVYFVNRSTGLPETERKEAEWHELLYVDSSAVIYTGRKWPLVLEVGGNGKLGLYGYDHVPYAHMAFLLWKDGKRNLNGSPARVVPRVRE